MTVRQEPRVGIELCVRGEPTILLVAQYFCEWDHRNDYLAVAKSDFRISAVSAPSEPLFRVEYERGASGPAPVAHIQVHAYRDECRTRPSRPNRTCGNAPLPWSLDGLPNRAVFSASSGASNVVPSKATSRYDR